MLRFICQPCRQGADLPAPARREDSLSVELARAELHGQCRGGTWCDCLHRLARKRP